MIDQLKKINIPFIKTVSNGTPLNKKNIDKIIRSGLDSIEISLDGDNQEMNDFIRKKSNHVEIISNIKKLLDQKILHNSNLKVTLSSTQFKYRDENEVLQSRRPDWLKKEFSKYINLKVLDIQSVDAMEWSDMALNKDIFEVVVDDLYKESNYCDHIVNTITIRSNGDVVACCYDLTSKLIMGNIKQDELKKIWNNEKYIKLRKSIDERNLFSICRKCSTVNKNNFLVLKNI